LLKEVEIRLETKLSATKQWTECVLADAVARYKDQLEHGDPIDNPDAYFLKICRNTKAEQDTYKHSPTTAADAPRAALEARKSNIFEKMTEHLAPFIKQGLVHVGPNYVELGGKGFAVDDHNFLQSVKQRLKVMNIPYEWMKDAA
jgi:hypothetical protein